MKRGIFAVGFPSEDDEEVEKATAKDKQKTEDRKKLQDLIMASDQKVSVNDVTGDGIFWSICRIL